MVVKMNWAKHFRHLNWLHCPASCGAGYMCMNQCCLRTKSLLLQMHFYAYQKYTWHFCLRLGPFKLFKRPISLIGFLFMLAIKCSFFYAVNFLNAWSNRLAWKHFCTFPFFEDYSLTPRATVRNQLGKRICRQRDICPPHSYRAWELCPL